MKKFFKSKIAVRGLGAVLAAAVVLALCLPVMARDTAEPTAPESSEAHSLTLLNAGAAQSQDSGSETDDSENSGTAGSSGGTEGTDGGSKVNIEESQGAGGVSTEEKDVNITGSQTGGQGSDASGSQSSSDKDEPDSDTGTQPTDPNEDDKTESGDTGEDGGEESEIDLGGVLTWYKYGNDASTVVCAPYSSASGRVLTAQLKNGKFAYKIDLTGEDSAEATITGITLRDGSGADKKADASGSLNMELGPGGTGASYVFTVSANVTRKDGQGSSTKENVTFSFVMTYENGIDLDLTMTLEKAGGKSTELLCSAGGETAGTIKNTEVTDGGLPYSFALGGSAAEDAEILSAGYVSKTGLAGDLDNSGKMQLEVPQGSEIEVYTVTVYAKVKEAATGENIEVVFTFEITYKASVDIELELTWYKKSTTAQTVLCDMNDTKSLTIKHNELNNNSLMYSLGITGESADQAKIVSAKFTGNSGTKNMEYPQGSVTLTAENGSASSLYRILVTAELKNDAGLKELVTFEITITYASDVSLEMRYTTVINGSNVEHLISCENNRTKTADVIFNDQLTEGKLPFSIKIVGDESGDVTIQKVTLYRSGDMKSLALDSNIGSGSYSKSTTLLLKDGKVGENQFTITAQDSDGTRYSFTINLPYMPRGDKEVVINTNVTQGQKVENDTYFDLTVEAHSVDENGNIISHIRAIGSETVLKVTLDGEEIAYSGTSGYTVQYRLYPKNPEVGDYNTHVLVIYARDEYGNESTKTYQLEGQRTVDGDVIGAANIYIDLSVLGLGVYGPIEYDVMANEPVSYVVAKAIWGEDTGEPYGTAVNTFGWDKSRCSYSGTLDTGFYLRGLGDGSNMGARATALDASSFESLGSSEEEVLAAIDLNLGAGSNMAILWRCIYKNGIPLTSPSTYSIREFDYTRGSGWVYSTGGTFYPGASMSDYTLQSGTTLILRYTLAYGWDIGGGQTGYGDTVGYCISCINGSYSVNHQYETITNEDGTTSYRCRCCGMIQDCPHEHTEWKDNGDGTCGEYCNDCNKYINELAEHTWEYTQDELGDCHIKTCTRCGAVENETHQWIYGESTATCTESGTVDAECEICGLKKKLSDPAKGHIYSDTWICDGAEHYQKCQVCGMEIPGTRGSHKYVDDGADGWECSVCRAYHDWDCGGSLELISGDCQHQVYECDTCGLTFIKYGTFDDAHKYENGVCTVCGGAEPGYAASALSLTSDDKKKQTKPVRGTII